MKTLVSAAVYAILIVTFGFQVARVEGQSMAPTLEDQDRLIVNKLVYRIGEPRRGDIVMLYYPLNPDKSFVKRVIAEEGDTVRIVDGRVYVNDVPLHDDYVPSEFRSHDDWGPQVIPEGYYFVMGDHRNNSSDSRHWGMVPKKYIIGKVQLRWWPVPDGAGVLTRPSRAPSPPGGELPAPGATVGRHAAVSRVLARVLLLNLVVAVAKIAFGYASGAISILSDGFHSLTDAARTSSAWSASAPPASRPTTTIRTATASTRRSPRRRSRCSCCWSCSRCSATPSTPDGPLDAAGHLVAGFVVMIGRRSSINLLRRSATRSREGERLGSEVLLADALQTRGDVWTSVAVIVALAGARLGRADSRSDRGARRRRLHRLRGLSDRERPRRES